MPEAAEVAVAAAQLGHVAVGRVVRGVTVTHDRTIRHLGGARLDSMVGRTVTGVARHGKWLVVDIDGIDERLGVHLRMSGQLLAAHPDEPHPDRHVHAVLDLGPRSVAGPVVGGAPGPPEGGAGTSGDPVEVRFRDPRTFGELRILPAGGVPVGPDILDPDVDRAWTARAAAGRRVGVKAVLLDQARFASGIGSYLADEMLHRARISPLRPAGTMAPSAWGRVLDAARELVAASAAEGGVTLPDEGWVDVWGRPGRFAPHLRVHGRDASATCGTATRRAVVGGRSARWCPRCQDARRFR